MIQVSSSKRPKSSLECLYSIEHHFLGWVMQMSESCTMLLTIVVEYFHSKRAPRAASTFPYNRCYIVMRHPTPLTLNTRTQNPNTLNPNPKNLRSFAPCSFGFSFLSRKRAWVKSPVFFFFFFFGGGGVSSPTRRMARKARSSFSWSSRQLIQQPSRPPKKGGRGV